MFETVGLSGTSPDEVKYVDDSRGLPHPMSGHYRRTYRALGRCLRFVLLGLALIAAEALPPDDGKSEQQSEQSEEPQEGQNQGEQGPATGVAETPALPAGESEGGKAEREQQANFYQRVIHYIGIDGPAQWVMAVAALGALGVSIWAVIILRDTLRATVRAVAAGRLATRQTLKMVQENAQRELRAYISMTGADAGVHELPDGRIQYSFRVVVTNTGQTPAYDVRLRGKTGVFPAPLPDHIDLSLPDTETGSVTVLGPGQQTFLAVGTEYRGPNDFSELRRGVGMGGDRVYVYGTTKYTDAFKQPRHTNFCAHVQFGLVGTDDIFYTAIRRHNDAT